MSDWRWLSLGGWALLADKTTAGHPGERRVDIGETQSPHAVGYR
jgi:hypothetical protein